MALVANLNGHRVTALDYSEKDWQVLKSEYTQHRLICNDSGCQSPMIPKTYHATGTQFFTHKSRSTDRNCSYAGGESPEHLHLKEIVYTTAKQLGYAPECEVWLPEISRRADVLIHDIVIEIQLSPQSDTRYLKRTYDYQELGKHVVWIAPERSIRKPVICPIAGLINIEPEGTPYIYTPTEDKLHTTLKLDEWLEQILDNTIQWHACPAHTHEHWYVPNSICDRADQKEQALKDLHEHLFGEVRKLFIQYWGFIVQATEKYPLVLPPKEAFHAQIQKRYGTDFASLTIDDLNDILGELEKGFIANIFKWLYPEQIGYVNHNCYPPFENLKPQARRAYAYARDLCNKRAKGDTPCCDCPDKHYVIGSFKNNGTYSPYLFCERCGSRATRRIKKELTEQQLENACEWVKSTVNYKQTDLKPWINAPRTDRDNLF